MTRNIAIFASGSGSNAENIATYFNSNKKVNISLLICNNPDAFVLKRAQKLKIPARIFTKKEFEQSKLLLETLRAYKIDFIILAGFLLRVPEYLIKEFPHSIVNIHPALLPRYGGKGMYGDNVHKAVVEAGEKESGITIHYINENFDEGEIIFQACCPISAGDTYKDVAEKVHLLEQEHFPKVIEELLSSDQGKS